MDNRRNMTLVFLLTIILLLVLPIAILSAQDAPRETIEFEGKVIEFPDYPDISIRVSKPFLRYQKWDSEHNGDSWFSIALELTNNTDQLISAVTFSTRLYNSEGSLVSESTNGTGPMTFEPQQGNVLAPGYHGVYDAFITRDKDFYGSFGRLEIEIIEVKTASKTAAAGPVFSGDLLNFQEYPGLEFQLSEPYRFLDDMSGNERFAIAMKFRNGSEKPVNFLNFFIRIFDEIGPLYEIERQEHNQKYDPGPKNFFSTEFPAGYEGINASFYTDELSFFDVFAKIEIMLMSVE